MAEYIDIDMPLDVFTLNGKSYKLFSTTLREFLECNEIPYKAADVVPVRHGRWVKKHDDVCYWHECSECGEKSPKDQWKNQWLSSYCPNCGAKMDGKSEKTQ